MQINTHLQIRYFHTAPRDARHSLHSRRFPPLSVPCNTYFLKLSNGSNWPFADVKRNNLQARLRSVDGTPDNKTRQSSQEGNKPLFCVVEVIGLQDGIQCYPGESKRGQSPHNTIGTMFSCRHGD